MRASTTKTSSTGGLSSSSRFDGGRRDLNRNRRRLGYRERSRRRCDDDVSVFVRQSNDDEFDLGQAIGERVRGETGSTLPPGRVGLLGVRETLEYLGDANGFIERRRQKYGDVFKTAMFFKPAVVFGSKESVREFMTFEGSLPADEALPETFRELHTNYGALRMSGARHQATRANFGRVLGRAALEAYAPVIGARTREFVRSITKQEGQSSSTFAPGRACVDFSLDLLFELFCGHVPDAKYKRAMLAYNGGLLSLGKWTPEFKSGKKALEELTTYVRDDYRRVKSAGLLDEEERYFFYKRYSEATDEFGQPFDDERIATTCVLMVWGSYIEAAALMGHSLLLLGDDDDARRAVLDEFNQTCCEIDDDGRECRRVGTLSDIMAMQYTAAVAKESLRVMPQTAGGLRVNPTARVFAGYDVPSGYVLTADPRIPFREEANFPDARAFKPERFVPGTAEAAKNVVNAETFFPGGMGQHQCPGISLAVVMTQIFLSEMASAFPNGWRGRGTPSYVQVPIVILDPKYEIEFVVV
jgi:cytochrome P450